MSELLYVCDRCTQRYRATLTGVLGRRCMCGAELRAVTEMELLDKQAQLAKLLDSDEPLEQLQSKIEKLLSGQ